MSIILWPFPSLYHLVTQVYSALPFTTLLLLLLLLPQLNIHKFKFVARFGLMHMVATNVCVWIRTLVRESLKEINEFKVSQGHSGEDFMIMGT